MQMPDFSKIDLDPQNIGNWPGALKGLVILVLCAVLLGAGYWFDTKEQLVRLGKAQEKEIQLKDQFEVKQRKAANLEPLREQLKEMKESFGNLLRLLPNKTEIEGLLVDISQSGLAAGLEFELFKPSKEQLEEFYAIQPITIRVTGSYHEFGNFVSSVAALPRIVTQHDVNIAPVSKGGKAVGGQDLIMSMVAKTYRYLEEEEIEAAAAAKNKGKKGKKKRRQRKKK
ncbi:MAG: type 4a pilus biogenesis protein PilO [Gammaproteobacteria bacterium]|nr:type 4a pilus biogenesis protein PilO [Gammaproteobacteria bacterium]NIR22904.1 type 4a pilus biogenesis protein PilO [Gammaproteobacteria bacterium]NIS04177.1 type 4a pilus biogenesis protein PilO [Gammaproteobacteria bacterium]NIV46361.1 type 4a pilus biogenesis protein PilO [Gammaproteobacteria bacterium]NIW01393.1 type 4a pilus biogenesis protein PilO [Gammaproteobacteria bacterium]